MFAVAVSYFGVSPSIVIGPAGEDVWFSFFHAVAAGRMATVTKFDRYNLEEYRVDFDGKEFEFFRY